MGRAVTWYWEVQDMVDFNQDPPVVDTEYEVFNQPEILTFFIIATRRLDDDADAKEMILNVTLDGVLHPSTFNWLNNTWYYHYLSPSSNTLWATTPHRTSAVYSCLSGRVGEITVEQTDTPGANAELDARIEWAIRKEV